MIRFSSLLAILLAWVGPEPLKVTTHPTPGPYFVGQGIEIRVEVAEAVAGVGFETPKASRAEIKALASDPNQPSTRRFVVIPRRAGVVEIPPFRASAGDRSGSSRSTRLTVANVPGEGRSAAFLGGVGAFEVKAEAEPTTLRAGQSLEFRIKLTGQGAWGSDRSPDLSSWKSLGGGLRVEPVDDLLEGVDPPVRTFRYRIRSRVAGRLVLPPVAVASFEPRTGRFSTRTTSSVAITVEKPPRLDPSLLDYDPILTTSQDRFGIYAVGFGVGLAGLASVALWFLARRINRSRVADPARLAFEFSRNLAGASELDAARRVVEALTTYLERVASRNTGVLTPPEARAAFERLTESSPIADRAERLVSVCDRVRYRGKFDPEGLIEEAQAFFERVAEVMGRKQRGEKGPREAAETA